MNVFHYFTPEQQQYLKKRINQFSTEQLKQFRNESNEIITVLEKEMKKNTPPDDPRVVAMAKQLKEISDQFVDSEMDKVINQFYEDHPDIVMHDGMYVKLYQYYRKSASVAR